MIRASASSITSTCSHDSNQELISKSPEDFKLVGFDQASASLQSTCFKLPDISVQNTIYAANFANSLAGDIIEKTSPLDSSTNLAILGATYIINGVTQAKQAYTHHSKLQELQNSFIRALPTKEIIATDPACKKTATNAFDLEDIIQIVRNNGKIDITMKKNIKFTLSHNGFWTLPNAGGAAISLGTSLTCAVIYISNRWNDNMDINNPNADFTLSTTDQAMLITAGLPLANGYNMVTSLLYKQEAKLFAAVREIIQKLYIDTTSIDKIPSDLLMVANNFMSEEDIAANQMTISAFKEFKNAKRINDLKLEIAEIKTTKQQVVIDVAPILPTKISAASTQSQDKPTAPKAKCVIS